MKMYETVVLILLLCAIGFNAGALEMRGEVGGLQFSAFPVPIAAAARISESHRQGEDGVWRDGVGKRIADPVVNFSGRYHLGLHSCGAACR